LADLREEQGVCVDIARRMLVVERARSEIDRSSEIDRNSITCHIINIRGVIRCEDRQNAERDMADGESDDKVGPGKPRCTSGSRRASPATPVAAATRPCQRCSSMRSTKRST
jgi:hypothetical protein